MLSAVEKIPERSLASVRAIPSNGYDACGDATSTTDPDRDVTSATYDDLGDELSSTDARDYTTTPTTPTAS